MKFKIAKKYQVKLNEDFFNRKLITNHHGKKNYFLEYTQGNKKIRIKIYYSKYNFMKIFVVPRKYDYISFVSMILENERKLINKKFDFGYVFYKFEKFQYSFRPGFLAFLNRFFEIDERIKYYSSNSPNQILDYRFFILNVNENDFFVQTKSFIPLDSSENIQLKKQVEYYLLNISDFFIKSEIKRYEKYWNWGFDYILKFIFKSIYLHLNEKINNVDIEILNFLQALVNNKCYKGVELKYETLGDFIQTFSKLDVSELNLVILYFILEWCIIVLTDLLYLRYIVKVPKGKPNKYRFAFNYIQNIFNSESKYQKHPSPSVKLSEFKLYMNDFKYDKRFDICNIKTLKCNIPTFSYTHNSRSYNLNTQVFNNQKSIKYFLKISRIEIENEKKIQFIKSINRRGYAKKKTKR